MTCPPKKAQRHGPSFSEDTRRARPARQMRTVFGRRAATVPPFSFRIRGNGRVTRPAAELDVLGRTPTGDTTKGRDVAAAPSSSCTAFDTGDSPTHAWPFLVGGRGAGLLFFAEKGNPSPTARRKKRRTCRWAQQRKGGSTGFLRPVTWQFRNLGCTTTRQTIGDLYFGTAGAQGFRSRMRPRGRNYTDGVFRVKGSAVHGDNLDFGPFCSHIRRFMQRFFAPAAGLLVFHLRAAELVAKAVQFPSAPRENSLLNKSDRFQGRFAAHTGFRPERDSGFAGKEIGPLLSSSDRKLRPTRSNSGRERSALYVWTGIIAGRAI